MKVKTFTTHTLAIIKGVLAIELSFNVWASEKEQKDISIVRNDYFISERINISGLRYEELTLLVFYQPNPSPQQ